MQKMVQCLLGRATLLHLFVCTTSVEPFMQPISWHHTTLCDTSTMLFDNQSSNGRQYD